MSILQNVERCIANQQTYKALNAFVALNIDVHAFQRAAISADDRLSRGQGKSPLDGRIIGIKDNICTTDLPTTCASDIVNGYVSPYSATVVEKLQAAGASIAGKTNLDEFGMGSHSVFSRFGPVHNMTGESLSAGGSSGGSAVAVATGQCFAALGTDTGGSVRLPASYTGIVGFKPSYGMVSRYGVIAYANSLDTVGILATTSGVAKQVFGMADVINGSDPQDPTSLPSKLRSRIQDQLRSRDPRWPLRIGVLLDYNTKELDPRIRKTWLQAIQYLHSQGHSIHTVTLPNTKTALSAYYIIAPAEASSNLAKYDGVRYGQSTASNTDPNNVLYAATRGAGFGKEVQRRILLGAYSLSASAINNYFIQAQKIRRLVQNDFNSVFALSNPLLPESPSPSPSSPSTSSTDNSVGIGVDVLISPTAPTLPPKLADVTNRATSIHTYSDDVLTVPASLAGLPAISIPVPLEDVHNHQDDEEFEGTPRTVGLQIIGQFGDEEMVFRAAEVLERWEGAS